MDDLLRWLNRNFRLLGVFAIFLCVATWALDLAELVHPCVYCRTQRTAIGLVGILMLFPQPRQWWVRWPAAVFSFCCSSSRTSHLLEKTPRGVACTC